MAKSQAQRMVESLRRLGFTAQVFGSDSDSPELEEAIDKLEWAATKYRPDKPPRDRP